MPKISAASIRVREKLDRLLEIHGDPRLAIESAYGSLEEAPRAAKTWLEEVTGYDQEASYDEEWAEAY